VVATIDASGWTRVDDDELRTRYEIIAGEVRSR